jgi:hypothetical protein
MGRVLQNEVEFCSRPLAICTAIHGIIQMMRCEMTEFCSTKTGPLSPARSMDLRPLSDPCSRHEQFPANFSDFSFIHQQSTINDDRFHQHAVVFGHLLRYDYGFPRGLERGWPRWPSGVRDSTVFVWQDSGPSASRFAASRGEQARPLIQLGQCLSGGPECRRKFFPFSYG